MNEVVAPAVLLPVAAVVAVALRSVPASSPPSTWSLWEMRLAVAATALVVPAAVALGVVDGKAEGVGAFLLWGLLAGVFLGAARLDREGLESDTRWLLDISFLAFAGVTVFFSVVDFGYVFLPSAACLAVAWRYARLRRQRRALRDLRHSSS